MSEPRETTHSIVIVGKDALAWLQDCHCDAPAESAMDVVRVPSGHEDRFQFRLTFTAQRCSACKTPYHLSVQSNRCGVITGIAP